VREDASEVKVLVICENEKLLSFTLRDDSGEGEVQQWVVAKQAVVMEQYQSFNWPFIVSSYGRHDLLVYKLD